MIEVNQRAKQFMKYKNMVYRNGPPPQKGIVMHLGPLMQAWWLQALEDKDSGNKNLEQLIELINEEGKLRMQRHQRRLQLLKVKRGNEQHSDFLYTIENLMSVAEFNKMTSNEMIIHLFAETADNTMSRLAFCPRPMTPRITGDLVNFFERQVTRKNSADLRQKETIN